VRPKVEPFIPSAVRGAISDLSFSLAPRLYEAAVQHQGRGVALPAAHDVGPKFLITLIILHRRDISCFWALAMGLIPVKWRLRVEEEGRETCPWRKPRPRSAIGNRV
jgi:hypothetical protein